MAYYEDRRYHPRDRRPAAGYAADYYDDPRGYSRHERDAYPRAGNDSVEEIQRDYPPGSDYAYERGFDSRRSRRPVYETVRRSSSVGAYDPYSSRPRRSKNYDDRRPRRSRYDSASSSSSSSPSPQRHRRRKSLGETALGALGLGAAASSSRHSDRDRDRRGRRRSYSRHGGRSPSSSRSRSRDRGGRSGRNRQRSEQRMAQAARAALTAGAVEAFRSRKDPGEWTGDKGKRILTAAVTAAGTDGLVDKDPNKHGTRHVIESTLAGLATNHFINGGRSQSRGRNKNGRSRSSGGGLKDLAATGALAAAGKEIYDRVSRSRSRPRGRGSEDSDDDRRGPKKRSKSISDYINKGMAALGIGEEAKERSRDRDDRDRRGERRRRHDSRSDEYSDSDADSDYRSRGGRDTGRGRGSRDVGSYRSMNERNSIPQNRNSAPRGTNGTRAQSADDGCDCSDSNSDLGDSNDEEKQSKKLKRDVMLTSGLATVATIHAVHGVYDSVQKRKLRMKEVEEGKITADEARKRRIKANTIDAASIGLAALGIKGAYGEWKEVNEKRKENTEFKHKCAERSVKRQQRQQRRSHSQGSALNQNRRSRYPDEIEYPDSPAHNGFSYHDGNPYGASTDAAQIAY